MSSKSAAATLVLNGGSVGGSAGVGGGSSGASTASSCLDKDVNEYSELLSYEQEVGMVSHLELGGGGGGGAGCPSPSLNKDPVISAGRHQPPPPTLRLFGASSKGPPSASPTSPPPLPVKLGIMGQKGAGRKPQVTNGSSSSHRESATSPHAASGVSADWIELSSNLSKDLKRDLLSTSKSIGYQTRRKMLEHPNGMMKGLNGGVGGVGQLASTGNDDFVTPLLPGGCKDSTSSISSSQQDSPSTTVVSSPSIAAACPALTSAALTTSVLNEAASPSRASSMSSKGPAPQPPTVAAVTALGNGINPASHIGNGHACNMGTVGDGSSPVIIKQPLGSTSVSRGLQVETEDLIQFSSAVSSSVEGEAVNNVSAAAAPSHATLVGESNNNVRKESGPGRTTQVRPEKATNVDDDFEPFGSFYDDLSDFGGGGDGELNTSTRTADEQMDYLESLEPCPCYAKCCIDSIVTLFCVTLLG